MDVFFLSADKPIVKSYETGPNGELIKHSYPFVYEVTSHEVSTRPISKIFSDPDPEVREERRDSGQGHLGTTAGQ